MSHPLVYYIKTVNELAELIITITLKLLRGSGAVIFSQANLGSVMK
jgi:hypothetical protein